MVFLFRRCWHTAIQILINYRMQTWISQRAGIVCLLFLVDYTLAHITLKYQIIFDIFSSARIRCGETIIVILTAQRRPKMQLYEIVKDLFFTRVHNLVCLV